VTDKAIIYCDGACSPNPGFGGWGAVLIVNGERQEYSGAEPNTTNNRMELLGAISALEILKIYDSPCDVTIYTDSKYVCEAFNLQWIRSWKRRNWIKSDNQPVKNRDLWERLISLIADQKTVKWEWVRGHSDNVENNVCDKLAVIARRLLEEQSKITF